MVFCGKLGDLRDVVQFGALSVVVEYIAVRGFHHEAGIVVQGVGQLLLREALGKAHRAIQVFRVVHFSDAAGVVACFGKGVVKPFPLVLICSVIVAAPCMRTILPGEHGEACRHADGSWCIASVKHHRRCGKRIQIRRLDLIIAQGVDGVEALLVGKQK